MNFIFIIFHLWIAQGMGRSFKKNKNTLGPIESPTLNETLRVKPSLPTAKLPPVLSWIRFTGLTDSSAAVRFRTIFLSVFFVFTRFLYSQTRIRERRGMVSLATSTFSRNLFPRPSLPYVVRALGTTLLQLHPKPTSWGPLSSSLKSCSAHFSDSNFNLSKSSNETLGSQDDLVVLGIETSCDDTAAAIVSSHSCFFLFELFHCGVWLFVLFIGKLISWVLFFILGEKQWWYSQPSCVFSGISYVRWFVLVIPHSK